MARNKYGGINDMPTGWTTSKENTISAVPVVRCRECKYYKPEEYFSPCVLPQGLECAKPNDFCSYGQRKEANHDRPNFRPE